MPSSSRSPFAASAVSLALGVGLLLSGCSAASASVDSGFLGGVATPAPESTIEPAAGSWGEVDLPDQYRVTVVATDADAPVAAAVVAGLRHAGATVEIADGDADPTMAALDDAPDLVVGVGADLVDEWSMITAEHLDQQFVLIGAQLAEPTDNVTAVAWDGAAFRGTGITPDDAIDADADTADRGTAAIAAGLTSILAGYTGIVIWLPEP